RALVGRVARLAGTTLGSLGLAAPVLLPTWLMLSASQRTPLDYAELEATSLGEPSTFLHTFVPPDLPLDMGAFNRDLLFAGTLTALLGLVGLLLRGRPAAALGRGLAVGLFLVVI